MGQLRGIQLGLQDWFLTILLLLIVAPLPPGESCGVEWYDVGWGGVGELGRDRLGAVWPGAGGFFSMRLTLFR